MSPLLQRLNARYLRWAEKHQVKHWPTSALWMLLLATSAQVGFWGLSSPDFWTPTIEMTNVVGFTPATLKILWVLSSIGLNLVFSALVAGYVGTLLTKRLFEPEPCRN